MRLRPPSKGVKLAAAEITAAYLSELENGKKGLRWRSPGKSKALNVTVDDIAAA
ncbi:hypothetical protein [Mesorhizobium sp. 1B3]|uniref:hypothetical protein n=1 Tax=Mesorhizobium sp. 1B3 TaxID=3243599 RepID=UPI003D958FF7